MAGDRPILVATSLQAALDKALKSQSRYASAIEYDYRWDEYQPGEVWRLMQRDKERKGRYSWTRYSVHTADLIDGGAS